MKQLLWGDWIRVLTYDHSRGYSKVRFGKKTYVMRKTELSKERVLEIIFLDVGQGDGCILTEPGSHDDPRIMIIDAGVGTNMHGFLKWRFRDFPESGNIHAAIITHPDKDHYNGFSSVFRNAQLKIEQVYHSGLIERKANNRLGYVTLDGFLTEVYGEHKAVKKLVSNERNRGRTLFPNLVHRAIKASHIGDFKALTTAHGTMEDGKTWMPEFAPQTPLH